MILDAIFSELWKDIRSCYVSNFIASYISNSVTMKNAIQLKCSRATDDLISGEHVSEIDLKSQSFIKAISLLG